MKRGIEKVFKRSSLEEFRNRENPLKDATPAERIRAVGLISGHIREDGTSPRLERVLKIIRKK
jgi:hypothetical protein